MSPLSSFRLLFGIILSIMPWHESLAELAFSRNARTYETVHSSLVMKGVGHACLGLLVVRDSLPCNPAWTAFSKESDLGVSLLLSNGAAALDKVKPLLDKQITQEQIESLFKDSKVLQIEANADLYFRSKYLNGRFTPDTVKGFFVIRNEANPDIEIFAIEEKGFEFQSGIEVYSNLFVGAQLRFLTRNFIRRQFKLLDLATPEGSQLLRAKNQNATYLEPGVAYIFPGRWRPRVSVLMANLGWVSETFEELPNRAELQPGFGISPPLAWGTLDLTLDYRSLSFEEADLEKLRYGAAYHFGAMTLTAGLDANGLSGGVYYALLNLNAGLIYSTTKFLNDDDYFSETVYVQLGWQI